MTLPPMLPVIARDQDESTHEEPDEPLQGAPDARRQTPEAGDQSAGLTLVGHTSGPESTVAGGRDASPSFSIRCDHG